MKLLFVHPGPLLYTNVFLRLEPLGLELVAEAARRAKHAVRLIDLQAESQEAYHRIIAEWRPEFIAFSCNYLANVPEIVRRDENNIASIFYLRWWPQRIVHRRDYFGAWRRCNRPRA